MTPSGEPTARIAVGPTLTAQALEGVPLVEPGDDLVRIVADAWAAAPFGVAPHDIVVVTSKLCSRAEGRFVALDTVSPSAEAERLAEVTRKDSRLVELVLRESVAVSRAVPDVLIVRSRLGVVGANAGIDASNVRGAASDEVLLLPEDPDRWAAVLRVALEERFQVPLGVIISDSLGRPFRLGSVGIAIGVSGLPALHDQRGDTDLLGRTLEHTITALADQVAAVADLVAGQAGEGRPVVIVRGIRFPAPVDELGARALVRDPERDLYA